MKAANMFEVFNRSIADYHLTDNVDSELKNPFPIKTIEALFYTKNWIDTVQWHLEDIIRDPNIEPNAALAIKRRIDKSNQNRTDLVEQIDEEMLSAYSGVATKENARLNTESPGWAIDRLSILALKIYHMQVEASRPNIDNDLQDKNTRKLAILNIQKEDLTLAINQLLDDLASGARIAKVYRQMKMYNDPELNPVLYKKD
jgi:hypothetical protein